MSLPVLVNHFRLPICYYFCYFLYINNQIQWHKHLPFIFVFVYSVSASLSLSLFCVHCWQKTQLKWRGLLLLLVLHLLHLLVLVLSFLINQRSPKPRLSELRKITTQRNARMATHQLALLGEAQFTEESQGDPSLISLFSIFFFSLMGFHLHVSYSSFCIKNTGTDGLGDMKLTFGTRVPGITFRTRKDDKVILLFLFFFFFFFYEKL